MATQWLNHKVQCDKLLPKAVRRGGGWVIVAKVAGLFSTLVGNAILSRILSPADLGVYYLLFSLINLTNFAAPLGLNRAVVKFLSENLALGDYARARNLLRKGLLIGDTSVLAFSMGLLVFRYTPPGGVVLASIPGGRIMLLGMVSAFFMSTSTLRGEAFLGMKNYRDAVLHRTMLQNLFFISEVAAVWLSGIRVTLDAVLLLLAASTLLDYLIASYKVWRWENIASGLHVPRNGEAGTFAGDVSWREILKISLPLWGTTIATFVLAQFPLWYLDWWQGMTDVALFGVAMVIKRMIFRFPSEFVVSVIPPLVAGEYAVGNKQKVEKLVRLGASFGFGSTLLSVIAFAAWGRAVLSSLFGVFYSQAYPLVLVLAVGELVNAWAGAIGVVLMMTAYQRVILKISLLTVFLGLCVGYLGVVRWGSMGMAWAASLSLALYNVLMVVFLYKKEHIKSYALLPLLDFLRQG